jgi:hypothetical protein
MNLRRNVVALVAALSLALSVTSAAFATDQSSAVTETLMLNPTSTITGAPTSIAYPSALGGANVVGVPTPAGPTVMNFTSNNINGFKVNIASTDLTSGANTIPNNRRRFAVQSTTACIPGASIPAGFVQVTNYADTTSGYQMAAASGVDVTFCTPTGPGTTTLTNFNAKLAIPAAQAAGAYTGTITFKLVETP